MLLDAAKKYNIDLRKSFMVGDQASDIEAGLEAGCKAIFLNRHYQELRPVNHDKTFFSINLATHYIIKQKNQTNAQL